MLSFTPIIGRLSGLLAYAANSSCNVFVRPDRSREFAFPKNCSRAHEPARVETGGKLVL